MIAHSAFYALLRQCARRNRPNVAALLLRLITRRYKRWESTVPRGRRNRALVMTRVGFLEDIDETFRNAADFELVTWPGFALKAFASALLSPQLDHNFYLTADPEIEVTKSSYRKFLAEVWEQYTKSIRIDVVLTGNFSYCAEREFAAMLESEGTPFIALHKENVRPPRRIAYWEFLYKERRGPFSGTKILVYNDIERELQIRSHVTAPQNIVVAGMPRLDRIHRWRVRNAGPSKELTKPQVLFFAFARHEKLTAIQRKASAGFEGNIEELNGDWGKLSWKNLAEGAHEAMISLAQRRPDVEVIIKTKGQRRKKNDIFDMLHSKTGNLPPNLQVVAGGDPFDLMSQSRVVVGFNTTGLLEAIAAGKPVVVPRFGEAKDEAMNEYIIDLKGAVTYAPTRDALISLVENWIDNPEPVPAELREMERSMLRYWVNNDDGAAGTRAYKAITDTLCDNTVRRAQH
jgi:glycosyltransferase involved in cell wall biosynthesis